MKAYYGNRFSPNMTKTPEGFLICHSVPIARTGWQNYMPREIGVRGVGAIKVYRSEAEVFSAITVASFEGKPVTDDHPPVGVDSCNYAAYTKGAVQNVRRGSGEQSDCLVADIVVHDAVLIGEIEGGKREISCGYDCVYELQADGAYTQKRITGNHVAVVKNGRAGPRVSIRDEKPEEEKKQMKKGNIFERMFGVFVKDAEPEEIREAADAISKMKDAEPEEVKEEKKEPTTDTAAHLMQMDARIANIEKLLTKDEESEKEEKTALDALEEELSKEKAEDAEEESVTVPAEKVNDEEPEEEKTKAADSAPVLAVIRAMKPVVAALPKDQRKSVCDAMNKAVRDAMAVKPTQQVTYQQMTKRKATDAAPMDNTAFGEACRKRNPHYKGEK